jgi:hypothetical protein
MQKSMEKKVTYPTSHEAFSLTFLQPLSSNLHFSREVLTHIVIYTIYRTNNDLHMSMGFSWISDGYEFVFKFSSAEIKLQIHV